MYAERVIRLSLEAHGGAETVHVDMAVLPQLLGKLWRERGVMVWWEIPEGISQGQLEEKGGTSVRKTCQGVCVCVTVVYHALAVSSLFFQSEARHIALLIIDFGL